MRKENELWRKARLYEGDDLLMMKWLDGGTHMGIVYHMTSNKVVIMRDEKETKLKYLTKRQKDSYADALDYLISIAHDRPYHVLMN